MKTIVVREFPGAVSGDSYTLDLSQMQVKHCVGCWTCWWKTPGKCVFQDLNRFYHEYVTADKVIFLSKVTKGFVSGNLKSLFDRMIPLFLPYTTFRTGESMHVKRYEKYPDIEFYYEGELQNENDREIFEDYIRRVFYQFYSEKITVKPIDVYSAKGV